MRKKYLYFLVASFTAVSFIAAGECSGKADNRHGPNTVDNTPVSRSIVNPLVKDLSTTDLTAERSRVNNASVTGRELTSDNDPETTTQYGSMIADIFAVR